MDAGRNLTLTSEQDSDNYDSKQLNASAGGSVGFSPSTASVSLSRDKMHSNYDSVQEQTGIFAGKGGFDITTGEHTQLNGAVIGSTAAPDKNRLDTGSLGFGDIENKARYQLRPSLLRPRHHPDKLSNLPLLAGGRLTAHLAQRLHHLRLRDGGLTVSIRQSGSTRTLTAVPVSNPAALQRHGGRWRKGARSRT
ncbi:hemagglutinin repeat-containing protein [Erwinia amylovora]|nr:hemagglutinin repeat-containing protein [Erwinia amylovora]MCK8159536.1 hemagglutinin repeat-containing protein [Erwinia amylovora]MCK8170058.1 hemagglutinin repeat-containing protein [Erwinia amylovora]MCK8172986.1 hemagglutinin repeat-containing protein [Erwinia amylovora]MCK8176679.1 hemagglutinin repeat-containing protein [Erwinia amylovora]MCK8193197.1 hemagglutinin repeat-containing protein [Erwinia amylovora]